MSRYTIAHGTAARRSGRDPTDPAHDTAPPHCLRCGVPCEPHDNVCWRCGCPELVRTSCPIPRRGRDAYVAV